jgi:hypothetical protein
MPEGRMIRRSAATDFKAEPMAITAFKEFAE